MVRDIFFFAGAYGVGKTTLCDSLSHKLHIPAYSASDLISSRIDEVYGARKNVTDKIGNQNALIQAISELPANEEKIILAGHFCIFDENQEIEELPDFVFEALEIKKIILLTTEPALIIDRLQSRDNVTYKLNSLTNLMRQEQIAAERVAKKLNCPLYEHKILFSNVDEDTLASFILTK